MTLKRVIFKFAKNIAFAVRAIGTGFTWMHPGIGCGSYTSTQYLKRSKEDKID